MGGPTPGRRMTPLGKEATGGKNGCIDEPGVIPGRTTGCITGAGGGPEDTAAGAFGTR